ncbi:MAG: PBECR2 nuclease fold domain-containing protein [Gammaproteobacteria bacterium]|nr:PBECR2 nuclease fold domain-containing protein [Gammaproteobacteria bacterium]
MPEPYEKLPFPEAIDFFRQKLSLPTETWTDIWEGMHARAFVVAGAMKQDLLTDFRSAVDRAITDGVTLDTFRKDFDSIVQKHGWAYKGGRGWRSRVIYDTNVRQAYNAGRELQMADPQLRETRPYGLYRHGDSATPRPLHLSWDGLVLPLDDPWWRTHTPMNGWGCSCKKFSISADEAELRGFKVAPAAPSDGSYEWLDKATGEVHRVPAGIDPGFAYNVGDAAWGRQLSEQAMASWKAQGAKAWAPLTPGGWKTAGRPEHIPLEAPVASLGRRVKSVEDVQAALETALGGPEKVFTVAGQPLLVNAQSLAQHIDANRAEFIPLINETLNDPYEVWLSFDKHQATGKVVLRQRIIKAVDIGKGKGVLVVANAVKGMLEAWTFLPTSDMKYLKQQRRGFLMLGR